MAKSFKAVFFCLFSFIETLLGIALAGGSGFYIWQVTLLRGMRNTNNSMLDFTVSWQLVTPWLLFAAGVFLVLSSLCTCCPSYRAAFVVTAAIGVVIAIAAAGLAYTVNMQGFDEFFYKGVWEAFHNRAVDAASFERIETALSCCGAGGPSNYFKHGRAEFPVSCCDDVAKGMTPDCTLAHEKHGCVEVVQSYARRAITMLSGIGGAAAVVGLLNVLIAVTLMRKTKRLDRKVFDPSGATHC